MYGSDYERRMMTTITTPTNSYAQYYTKYYTHGNYEEIRDLNAGEVVSRDCYIFAGNGLAAIYRIKDNATNGDMYYIHKDHLGSLDVVTNESGTIVDKYAFDAWGNRRMHDNWTLADNNTHLFDRGFTGHEHLDKFGLINMNGRLYDPKVARFLSPDPFIQAPDNSQSLNRYSYCLNNPLKYTDPSGYKFLGCDWSWGTNIFEEIFCAIGDMFAGMFGTIFGDGKDMGDFIASHRGDYPGPMGDGGGGGGGSGIGCGGGSSGGGGGGSGVAVGSGSRVMGGIVPGSVCAEYENLINKLTYITSGQFKVDEYDVKDWENYYITAGNHVQIEVKSLNVTGLILELEDHSTWNWETANWHIPKKIYSGDSYEFSLLPGQTKTFNFSRFANEPYSWNFFLSTSASYALVVLNFYSNLKPPIH